LAGKTSQSSNLGVVVAKSSSGIEMVLVEKLVSSASSNAQDDFVPLSPMTVVRLNSADVRPDQSMLRAFDSLAPSTFSQLMSLLDVSCDLTIEKLTGTADKEPTLVPSEVETKSDTAMDVEDESSEEYLRAVLGREEEDMSQESPGVSKQSGQVDSNLLADVQAGECILSTSLMKSADFIMQTESSSRLVILQHPDVLHKLLSLSVLHPKMAGKASVEALEERWASLWEELCVIDSGVSVPEEKEKEKSKEREKVPKSSDYTSRMTASSRLTADLPPSLASALGAGMSMGRASRGSNILESAARAGLLPFVSSTFSRTPPAAELAAMITQMTDMGLPREWAEAALKRCRYNVEMAINMCFESGVDMSQIVAEEVSVY
jgi:hypothetical protein